MVYAGFWRRFAASFIDGIVVILIAFVLQLLGVSSVITGILIGFLYQPFFESSRMQGTPGKSMMGLRITDLRGGRISFKAAVIRYLVRIVSGLLLCIGYLIMLFTEKKQTMHDLVAETLVVEGEIPGQNMFQVWYQQVLNVLGMVDKVPEDSATFTPSASASASASTTAQSTASPADLAGLYELYQKGILTEAEYNEKRAELLKKL